MVHKMYMNVYFIQTSNIQIKIVSAASVGLEPGILGFTILRATANLFHQLHFRERNEQYWIFESFVYIEIYGVLLRETRPKMIDLV